MYLPQLSLLFLENVHRTILLYYKPKFKAQEQI
jgi:hypothetical protein